MTLPDQTRAERIAATLDRSDFLSTRSGLVSTDDLRACLPYEAKPVTLQPTPYDREVRHD